MRKNKILALIFTFLLIFSNAAPGFIYIYAGEISLGGETGIVSGEMLAYETELVDDANATQSTQAESDTSDVAETVDSDLGEDETLIEGDMISVSGGVQTLDDPEPTGSSCFTFSEGVITAYDEDNNGCPKEVVIPREIEGEIVSELRHGVFSNKALTSVIIPDSVTTIGHYTFGNNQLTSVIIPDSVITILNGTFSDNKLTSVIIGNSVESIGNDAFKNNLLTEVIIPDSVITILNGTFSHNQLTSVIIGNSVESIGYDAFSYNLLTEVTIPASISSLMPLAFAENPLKKVIIADGDENFIEVTNLIDQMFMSYMIEEVVLGNTVVNIGVRAFYNNSISSLLLGNKVKNIGEMSFYQNLLTELIFPDSVETIGKQAFMLNEIETVVLGNGIKSINDMAFAYNNLNTINFPDTLESIGDNAFDTNHLTSIVLPNSITSIDRAAFARNELNSVILGTGLVTIKYATFAQNNLSSLIIPDSIEIIEQAAFGSNPGLPNYDDKVVGIITKDISLIDNQDDGNIVLIPGVRVSFDSQGGSQIDDQVMLLDETTQATQPETPSKEGFVFGGWYNDEALTQVFDFATILDDHLTLYAKWESISPSTPNSSGGGGFGAGKTHGSVKNPLDSKSSETTETTKNPETTEVKDSGTSIVNILEKYLQDTNLKSEQLEKIMKVISLTKDNSSSQEQKDAYIYAYLKGITTQDTIESAELDRGLTRAELAKMMVVFAKDLGKEKKVDTSVSYADTASVTGDLADYIQQAYQMQIMGIDADGNPLENFDPHREVSRAEFATVLSRVLFGDQYNQGAEDYYSKHLEVLKNKGILQQDNPHIKELRGWVMLMLMRAEQLQN